MANRLEDAQLDRIIARLDEAREKEQEGSKIWKDFRSKMQEYEREIAKRQGHLFEAEDLVTESQEPAEITVLPEIIAEQPTFPYKNESEWKAAIGDTAPWSVLEQKALFWKEGSLRDEEELAFIDALHNLDLLSFGSEKYKMAPERASLFGRLRRRKTKEAFRQEVDKQLATVGKTYMERWLDRQLGYSTAKLSDHYRWNIAAYILTEDPAKRKEMRKELERYVEKITDEDDPNFREREELLGFIEKHGD